MERPKPELWEQVQDLAVKVDHQWAQLCVYPRHCGVEYLTLCGKMVQYSPKEGDQVSRGWEARRWVTCPRCLSLPNAYP